MFKFKKFQKTQESNLVLRATYTQDDAGIEQKQVIGVLKNCKQ
jgi:hypothetical protein